MIYSEDFQSIKTHWNGKVMGLYLIFHTSLNHHHPWTTRWWCRKTKSQEKICFQFITELVNFFIGLDDATLSLGSSSSMWRDHILMRFVFVKKVGYLGIIGWLKLTTNSSLAEPSPQTAQIFLTSTQSYFSVSIFSRRLSHSTRSASWTWTYVFDSWNKIWELQYLRACNLFTTIINEQFVSLTKIHKKENVWGFRMELLWHWLFCVVIKII